MARIYIDGQQYEVEDGQNLLAASLVLGKNLPYFCWHPALGSVGACRQCAVKQFRDENDTRGRLVMACMTPATEGARIAIEDEEAREFRASVIEWLMVNHPHDCPVCDEGGECHLQDMTVMTGHDYRRYRANKRTWRNQDLGPLVNQEMNRCIQCYRCVRFYQDYADGHDFSAFSLRKDVFFGRAEDGVLESQFAGNLVEVCPTGVFTDKSLRFHYTRKWDLQTAPSVCVNCSVGCNTIPGERYGSLRRIRNRYNGQVNGYFLCDRGRYGYEFVNSERRVREPLTRGADPRELEPATRADALREAAAMVADGAKVIGIGSPRASLEANFALRTLVGPDRFYSGMSERESTLVAKAISILRDGPARSATLRDVSLADAVLLLGEDVDNSAPMIGLALRQSVRQQPMKDVVAKLRIPEWDDHAVREAVQDARGPFFIASPYASGLDELATSSFRGAPEDIARLGFAVAAAISGDAPAVPDVGDMSSLAAGIARALQQAERPVIVSGTGPGSPAVLEAAANVAWALCRGGKPAGLCLALPECNSMGAGLIEGGTLEQALAVVRSGQAETVVVLENDLYRRGEASAVDELLGSAKHVIVIDHLRTPTTDRAHAVFPAATFAEGDGTFVNYEGRAQRFYQVFVPEHGDVQESWRWLRDLMVTAGRSEAGTWHALDDVIAAMTAALPQLRPAADAAPPASYRVVDKKVAREPARYSGRTAMLANVNVHEPKPPDDPDSALAFSMEGFHEPPPASALITHFWAPGWNSIQALNKFQEEIGGPLRGGDPGVRLIEPAAGAAARFFEPPAAFAPRPERWFVVPVYHVFGSEELSMLTPGVASLAPAPYIGLGPAEAAARGVNSGDEIELTVSGRTLRLPLRLVQGLPSGVAGLPAGGQGLEGLTLPDWSEPFGGSERTTA